MTDTIDDVAAAVQEQLVSQARAKGIELVGPDGLLSQLTKRVLEAALEAEMSDDLGYDFECALARAGAVNRHEWTTCVG